MKRYFVRFSGESYKDMCDAYDGFGGGFTTFEEALKLGKEEADTGEYEIISLTQAEFTRFKRS